MHILLFKPIIHKNIFMVFKWVTMLFSWSKYNHIAYFYNGKAREAKGKGYRELKLAECIEQSGSVIHAFKFLKPIDKKKLQAFHKKMIGKKFDAIGSIYSEAEKWKWLGWIFKTKANDDKVFCSEAIILLLQDQGYFPKDRNANLYSPQEVLDRLITLELIDPNFEVWK